MELLLLGHLTQDLPYQAGSLLLVDLQLRLVVLPGLHELGLLVLLVGQLREAQGLILFQLPGSLPDGDLPQPGQEELRVPQVGQVLPGQQVGVLVHVPGEILVPNHGVDGAIDDGAAF